jgi:hypothetical protein
LKIALALIALTLAACGPQVTETACKNAGGQCVGVGSCGLGSGHMDNHEKCPGEPDSVCCQPASACGGPTEFVCCAAGKTFSTRPECTGGQLQCLDGWSQSTTGTCP